MFFRKKEEGIMERCRAELEVQYTVLFSMENAMDWHLRHEGTNLRGLLELAPSSEQAPKGEYTVLWQSIVSEPDRRAKKRVIYALSLESALRERLEEGTGAITLNN